MLELYRALARIEKDQKAPTVSELYAELVLMPDRVVNKNGLYTLVGREENFNNRHNRYIASLKLLKKAKRFARGLRHMPFVRSVAVSGSVVQLAASDKSDIDIFIITAKNRIFLTRFVVSAYFQLFGGRRHGEKINRRFCLNHYVAGPSELPSDHNLYTAMLYTNFLPVCGKQVLHAFISKNISWIKEFLLCPSIPETLYFKNNAYISPMQIVLEMLLYPFAGLAEKFASYLQRLRIKVSPTVLVSESELSFHPASKGQRILARYEQISQNFNA